MTLGKTASSVRFEGVTKAFGEVVAVRDISFTIEPGTLVTLLGPSGCGKTTTLRLIAGLEMSNAGKVLIGDKDVTKLAATDRDVCMVFQSYALFPHMTVIENVAYGLTVGNMARAEAHAKAEDHLELVGLGGYGERLPSELSGGQQQRVAVARALILQPEVLLFDEPLSNLDAKLRRRMREEICELQQSLGLTTVYVTHDQEEALAVSDRIIVMDNAVIAQEGSPRDIYERPDNLFVADFIGDATVVEAEIVAIEGDMARIRIGDVEHSLAHRGFVVGPVNLAIRPESILLSTAAGEAGLVGTVSKATYLGNHMEYTVDSAIGELFVVDSRISSPIPQGEQVSIELANHGVTFVQD